MDSSSVLTSKKRVLVGSSSSSEPEVIQIGSPMVDQTSNTKLKGKEKEVAYYEIIDVDIDEDCDDVVLLEGKVESNKKVKVNMSTYGNAAKSNSKKVGSKGKEVPVDANHDFEGFIPGSDNIFDLDDDYVDDSEYWALQSHFDGVPAGVEAPVPWFPDLFPQKNQNSSIPFETSNAQLEASVSQPNNVVPMPTSLFSSSKKSTAIGGQSTYFDPKHVPVHSSFIPVVHGSYLSNNTTTQVGNVHSTFPQLDLNTAYPLGMYTPISEWHQSAFMMDAAYSQLAMDTTDMLSGFEDIYSMNDMLFGQDATLNGPSSESSSSVETSPNVAILVDGDLKKRYESFKKFDTVVDHSDHHYAKTYSPMTQPPKNWAKKIQEEWKILEKDLPDTIFVRAYETRMDLLRAVISGAEGTPYQDGLFFFDVCFPSSYPNSPPLVHYRSGGLRINPNLYNGGKVCLSLLNTWGGQAEEMWIPGTSTMLQVLVSIQALILNMKPYFNEPAFEPSRDTVHGEQASMQYNESTFILSLKTMVYTMNRPPKNFEDLVIGHFQNRVRDILMACKAYIEGVQVGCLAKGGVQRVDDGNNSCSPMFKHNVGLYIKTLVAAFEKIGAKEAQEFLSLSVEESSFPTASWPGPVLALFPSPYPGPNLGQYPDPFMIPTPSIPPSYKPTTPSYSSHGYPPFPSNSASAESAFVKKM